MIRPAVVFPSREQMLRAGMVGLLGGLAVSGLALAGLAATTTEPGPQQIPVVVETVRPIVVPVATAVPMPTPILIGGPKRPGEPVGFVFTAAGNTYLKLADLAGERMVRHGKRRMTVDNESMTVVVVADVAAEHLSELDRTWDGRGVILDNGCETSVTGFAVVSRLTGDPAYAAVEGTGDKWDLDTAFSSGNPVLAARIDGCADGTFARAAELGRPLEMTAVTDDALAARARDAFIASPIAAVTQVEFATGRDGMWYAAEGALTTRVLRHPTTHVTWVAVTGYYVEGCGGPDINVLGLYRVDAAGALEPIAVRDLGEMYQVEKLIDVDDDGVPELLGRDWLGLDRLIVRAGGDAVTRLSLAFYGCPC